MPGSVPRDGAWTLMRHLSGTTGYGLSQPQVSRATAESALGWTGRLCGAGALAMSQEAREGSPEEETPRSSGNWPRKEAWRSWGGGHGDVGRKI